MTGDPHRYDDIIHLPHFVSQNRKHMSLHDRAAQFAPFAALSGYDESIRETARLTDHEDELSESSLNELDMKLQIIRLHIKEQPLITLTYFIPDEHKEGGRYETVSFHVSSVDQLKRVMITADKQRISIDHISRIESELFEESEDL